MKVNIKIEPTAESLARKFLGAEKILAKRLWEGLTAYAYLIQGNSQRQTPVDSGLLRSSIGTTLQPSKVRAIIQPEKPYERWIHEGWMKRDGRVIYLQGKGRAGTPFGGKPYMKLGAEDSETQGNRIISAKINQAIGEL